MKKIDTKRKYSQIPSVRKIGRPKKWETVEELEEQIQDYFDSCFVPLTEQVRKVIKTDEGTETTYETVDIKNEAGHTVYEQIRPFTVTGLAVSLDTTRETLLDYEKKPENAIFSDTIKRAKQIIKQYAEEYLYDGKNQTGAIFNLKNNWGWVDRNETDITTKGKEISPAIVEARANEILEKDD